jgi:outer membrane receptor for ferrienterochelin and colicin
MLPPQPIPVANDEKRMVTSLTLQDQIDVSDSLTLTLGARYDDNSDIGSRVTQRFSVVW